MGEPVQQLLDQMERMPVVVVADTCLPWALMACARRGIPACSLWTQPATFFLALYNLDTPKKVGSYSSSICFRVKEQSCSYAVFVSE
jgi:hypothetical protein